MPATNSAEASTRRRDPEATRAAILDAAERLFVDRGVAGAPTSEIARQAGVTKSLIHHHFGSKDVLWNEVKLRRFSEYYELQREMLSGSRGTVELLERSLVAYFRFLQKNPDAVRFMTWRFLDADDPCLDLEDELYALGIEKIREAQEAGEIRADLEPIFVVKTFLGLAVHWFQSRNMLCSVVGPDADWDDMDERYLNDVLRIYFEGVRPPSPR